MSAGFHLKHFEREFIKRQREREKSQKKDNFFRRDFFQRKFSFPRENSLFTYFSLNIVGEELSNMKMEALDVLEL